MNAIEKIKKSWWVILSFLMYLNGFGFIYIGAKHNNKNWILEGIMYEVPWFLYLLISFIYGLPVNLNLTGTAVLISLLLMFVSIVRSIWVAVKLCDVYDNQEKYQIQTTVLKNHNIAKDNNNTKSNFGCCLCLIIIFIVFMIIVL
ncbi:hypothetical protein [uncultured Methanobrevibacter sp.]|uniref:hypothetical protein n=1 Tax=uncultured Methanobrevibacter sp. TaxID=253161 RepID=UPI00260C9A16|nr:hypothetical protein [uncultured Methanobrevibacter sp.]